MKRIPPISALALATLLSTTACDQCTPEEICQSTYLADLALDVFQITPLYNSNTAEYYTIVHGVLNAIDDIAGCEQNAATAGPNLYQQQIYYSPEPSFANPTLVTNGITDFSINALSPGSLAGIHDTIGFVQDGYYLFNTYADYTDVVTERNIHKNESDYSLSRSQEMAFNHQVIHVTHTSKKPVYDKNGNRMFFQRVGAAVTYQ